MDIRLSYKLFGFKNAEAIVFIHGLGLDKNVWSRVVENISATYLCITIDLPGSGESPYIKGATMDTFIGEINKIFNKHNVSKIHFVGHSLGGYVSLAYTQKFPFRVQSLCLFHSHCQTDDSVRIQSRKQIIDIVKHKRVQFFFDTLISNQFAPHNQKIFKIEINNLLQQAYTIQPDSLIQYQQIMIERQDFSSFLQQHNLPILFIFGVHDTFINQESIRQQSILSIQGQLQILNHSAHIGMIEEKEESVRILKQFYKSIGYDATSN